MQLPLHFFFVPWFKHLTQYHIPVFFLHRSNCMPTHFLSFLQLNYPPLHSLTFEQQRNMQLSLKINQLWFHPLFFLILTISCFLWVHLYETHISGSDLVLLTFWCGAREGQRTGSFTLIGKPVKFACEVLWGCPTLFLVKWKLTVNPSLVYTFTASPTRSCCCPGYGRGNSAPVGPELEQGGAPAGRVSWGVGERTWTIS